MAMPAVLRPTLRPLSFTVGALAALISACGEQTMSPKLEPPITVPKPPTLDLAQISCRSAPEGDAGPKRTAVVGGPGAVDPAEGIVRAYDLDDTSPPVDSPVSGDGGFEVDLAVEPGDRVRLEVIGQAGESGPRDLVLRELDAPLEPWIEPLGDCLSFNPGYLLWVGSDGQGELVVEGSCNGIELSTPSPRSKRDRIRIGADQDWPLSLEKGAPLSLRIEVLEGEPGDEYLFFLEATAPESDRRAVTVRVVD